LTLTPSILTVNGTSYNQLGRKTHGLCVDVWGWDVDSDYFLEFHEVIGRPQPFFTGPFSVTLQDFQPGPGANLRFTGDIVTVQPSWGVMGRTWGYSCQGFKYRANQFPVVAIDGSTLQKYNLPASDDDYIASLSGQSIGQIIAAELTRNAASLTAAGITTDATTTSQLAALSLVPSDPVMVQGERFWSALEQQLQRWLRNARLIILPSGLVRVVDVTTGAAHSLTLGSDPVDPPLFSRSWQHCAPRTKVIGRGNVAPGYLSMGLGTITKSWSAADETAWKLSDFESPHGGTDSGTVTSVGGPVTVTVKSADASLALPVNYWNGLQAWVHLRKNTGTGITYQESRPIAASTALTAGGTYTLTLGYALDNSAAGAWDHYQIVGTLGTAAIDPRNNVYRLMNVNDPGGLVKNHLVKAFPVDVPWTYLNNAASIMVRTPQVAIMKGGSGRPYTFRVLPSTGQILFDFPYVKLFNSDTVLAAGGAGVVQPDDIIFLLAYSRGGLSVAFPADVAGVPQYNGTSYSAGLVRTGYVSVDSFAYQGNTALVGNLAQMVNVSTRDTVIEGVVRYKGAYPTVYDPSGGHLLNIAAVSYTTGDESLAIPVRSLAVRYQPDGGTGLIYQVEMKCSTKREPRTGDDFYTHLSVLGSGQGPLGAAGALGGGGWNPFGVATPSFGEMREVAQAAAERSAHLMDVSTDQGEGLGIGFAGPGGNASQRERYRRNRGQHDRNRQHHQAQEEKREKHQQGHHEEQAKQGERLAEGAEGEQERHDRQGQRIAAVARKERQDEAAKHRRRQEQLNPYEARPQAMHDADLAETQKGIAERVQQHDAERAEAKAQNQASRRDRPIEAALVRSRGVRKSIERREESRRVKREGQRKADARFAANLKRQAPDVPNPPPDPDETPIMDGGE
jgi:hypothetical protein